MQTIWCVSAVLSPRIAKPQAVDQRGHYSNPPSPGKRPKRCADFRTDLLDQGFWEAIEALVQESQTTGRRTRRRPHPHGQKQVQRHLELEEIEHLIVRYLAGATAPELAEAHGIHRTTALALLERHQIPRHGRVWRSVLTERAIRLYAEGRSCAAIARQFKVNPETVRQHLLAAGVTLRSPGRPRSTPP